MRMVGLFAGIGGIEQGFHEAFGDTLVTTDLCEFWEPAQRVLRTHFSDAHLHPDVREFERIPDGTNILAAGFPCTDLSQAGRTAGIAGSQSGLVAHAFEALRASKRAGQPLPWLLIENVSNMLVLDGGNAMRYLVDEIEALGYSWAYRTVDSRFTGVPQRRRRVILLASTEHDPGAVLFADDAGEPAPDRYRDDAFGFYWTEGVRGLGWAQDAVPTLKGGSTVGIPSPPAIWIPDAEPGRKLVYPRIEDAERMQGFEAGWTIPGSDGRRDGTRWKMVGNAVTVGVSSWAAHRLAVPGSDNATRSKIGRAWPTASCGGAGRRFAVRVSEFPLQKPYLHLLDIVDPHACMPLTHRAARGFLDRLESGNLGRFPGFRDDVAEHVDVTATLAGAVA